MNDYKPDPSWRFAQPTIADPRIDPPEPEPDPFDDLPLTLGSMQWCIDEQYATKFYSNLISEALEWLCPYSVDEVDREDDQSRSYTLLRLTPNEDQPDNCGWLQWCDDDGHSRTEIW